LNNFLYVLYLYLLIISLVRVRCPVLPAPFASAAAVLPAPPASTASSAAKVPFLILLRDFVPRPPPLPQLPLTPSLRLRFDRLLHLSRSRVSSFMTSVMWRQCQRCTAPLPGPLLCLRCCRLCRASDAVDCAVPPPRPQLMDSVAPHVATGGVVAVDDRLDQLVDSVQVRQYRSKYWTLLSERKYFFFSG
jgi:hypothetical protein